MASNRREDLRGELLAAAGVVLAHSGHEWLSMRKLAADVGVSSGAPYKHFADRRALLLGLAQDGFDRLIAAGEAAVAQGGDQALEALAHGFLAFCDAEPNLVALMYDSELTRPVDPALQPAFQRAYALVAGAVETVNTARDPGLVAVRSITFWSTLFGLARLTRNQLLEPFADPGDVVDWRARVIIEAIAAAKRA